MKTAINGLSTVIAVLSINSNSLQVFDSHENGCSNVVNVECDIVCNMNLDKITAAVQKKKFQIRKVISGLKNGNKETPVVCETAFKLYRSEVLEASKFLKQYQEEEKNKIHIDLYNVYEAVRNLDGSVGEFVALLNDDEFFKPIDDFQNTLENAYTEVICKLNTTKTDYARRELDFLQLVVWEMKEEVNLGKILKDLKARLSRDYDRSLPLFKALDGGSQRDLIYQFERYRLLLPQFPVAVKLVILQLDSFLAKIAQPSSISAVKKELRILLELQRLTEERFGDSLGLLERRLPSKSDKRHRWTHERFGDASNFLIKGMRMSLDESERLKTVAVDASRILKLLSSKGSEFRDQYNRCRGQNLVHDADYLPVLRTTVYFRDLYKQTRNLAKEVNIFLSIRETGIVSDQDLLDENDLLDDNCLLVENALLKKMRNLVRKRNQAAGYFGKNAEELMEVLKPKSVKAKEKLRSTHQMVSTRLSQIPSSFPAVGLPSFFRRSSRLSSSVSLPDLPS